VGDSDYEYVKTVRAAHLPRLFEALGVEVGDRKGLLRELDRRFHGNECFSAIGDFLDGHGIEHETFTWS
jgi:hypothetical protein